MSQDLTRTFIVRNLECCTTYFFGSASIPTILSIGQWFRCQTSFSKTISPTAKFRILFFGIYLTWGHWRICFLHLLQNSTATCFTHWHLVFKYASAYCHAWWKHDSNHFHGKGITWWKWCFTPWVTDGLYSVTDDIYSEWYWVNDKFNFSHQCSELFIFQGATFYFQKSCQNSSCRSTLVFPDLSNIRRPGVLLCYRNQFVPFSCKKLLFVFLV